MPIVDIQARFRELGRIRLGAQQDTGKTRNGKPVRRPVKLPRFRLTSPWPHLIEQASEVFGGDAGPCDIDGTQQWEVIVEVDALPVVIPPGEVFDQWYELWTGGGCARRCDGARQVLVDRPCQCPDDPIERQEAAAKGKACKPTTRLRLMLPDVADVGIWRLESHGFHAAAELGGAAGLVEAATRQGAMIPADLRLSEREGARRPGQPRKKFFVPSISFRGTLGPVLDALGILEAGADMPRILGVEPRPSLSEGGRAELPSTAGNAFDPAPVEKASFPGSPPPPAPSGPVDAPDPGPADAIGAGEPPSFAPPAPEAPAAPDVPEPAPLDVPEPEPGPDDGEGQGGSYTGPQIIAIKLGDLGVKDRAHRLHVVSSIVGRPLESSKDLTAGEVRDVVDTLNDPGYDPPSLGEGREATPEPDEPSATPSPAPSSRPSPPPAPIRAEVVDGPPRSLSGPTDEPEEWNADRWRAFLRDRGVKVADVMRAAAELDAGIDNLAGIAGSGVAAILAGFVEETALEKGTKS